MKTVFQFTLRDPSFPLRWIGIALLIALLGVVAMPTRASGPYVVNVSYDGPDTNTGDGICYDGVSGCTLRAAIQQASADGAATTITFDSSLAGATLALDAAYGTIAWTGSNIYVNGEGLVAVSGAALNYGDPIFSISGNDNTLASLSVVNSNGIGIEVGDVYDTGAGNRNRIYAVTLTGNLEDAILVFGGFSGGGQDTILDGNLIGAASWVATSCAGGAGNGAYGIRVTSGAHRTYIWDNRIVCNGDYGVYLSGAGATLDNVQLVSNEIGGYEVYDLGNANGGVFDSLTSNTVIQGSLISGNAGHGVTLDWSNQTILRSNVIGASAGGVSALPNDQCGVNLINGAHHATIGGTDPAYRNTISGNGDSGVCIYPGSGDNFIEGNAIGLNGNGNAAIPNGEYGVWVWAADNNQIGSSAGLTTQWVSANTLAGIYLQDAAGTLIGHSNRVGVGSDDTTAFGNGDEGILLDGAWNTAVFPYKVAFNGGAGIAVVGKGAINNVLSGFEDVHGNGGIAIDLGNDGHTANGSQTPPGPNDWLAYPIIAGNTGSLLYGTACPNCVVVIFRAKGNPTLPGGGGTYMTQTTADASGNWDAMLSGGVPDVGVSAMACEAPCFMAGNSSEMSPRYFAEGGAQKIYLPMILRQP